MNSDYTKYGYTIKKEQEEISTIRHLKDDRYYRNLSRDEMIRNKNPIYRYIDQFKHRKIIRNN